MHSISDAICTFLVYICARKNVLRRKGSGATFLRLRPSVSIARRNWTYRSLAPPSSLFLSGHLSAPAFHEKPRHDRAEFSLSHDFYSKFNGASTQPEVRPRSVRTIDAPIAAPTRFRTRLRSLVTFSRRTTGTNWLSSNFPHPPASCLQCQLRRRERMRRINFVDVRTARDENIHSRRRASSIDRYRC